MSSATKIINLKRYYYDPYIKSLRNKKSTVKFYILKIEDYLRTYEKMDSNSTRSYHLRSYTGYPSYLSESSAFQLLDEAFQQARDWAFHHLAQHQLLLQPLVREKKLERENQPEGWWSVREQNRHRPVLKTDPRDQLPEKEQNHGEHQLPALDLSHSSKSWLTVQQNPLNLSFRVAQKSATSSPSTRSSLDAPSGSTRSRLALASPGDLTSSANSSRPSPFLERTERSEPRQFPRWSMTSTTAAASSSPISSEKSSLRSPFLQRTERSEPRRSPRWLMASVTAWASSSHNFRPSPFEETEFRQPSSVGRSTEEFETQISMVALMRVRKRLFQDEDTEAPQMKRPKGNEEQANQKEEREKVPQEKGNKTMAQNEGNEYESDDDDIICLN